MNNNLKKFEEIKNLEDIFEKNIGKTRQKLKELLNKNIDNNEDENNNKCIILKKPNKRKNKFML